MKGELSNEQLIRLIKLDIISDNTTEYTKLYNYILDKINSLERYVGKDGYCGHDVELPLNEYVFYGNSMDSICIDVYVSNTNTIQLCKSKFLSHILTRYENISDDIIEYVIKYIIEIKEGVNNLVYISSIKNLPPIKKL